MAGPLDHARISAGIKAGILGAAPDIRLRVDVDTDAGAVSLRGEVASDWQKQEAERVAREVCPCGVTRIINELTVNS